jgi:hypothetical protein
MVEKISLSSLLKVSDNKATAKQETQKKESRQISVDYLSTLNGLLGPKTALRIAMEYTPDDLIRMEAKYDEFRFDTQPKKPKGKLERILKFLEWKKEFRDVTSMDYYMENITESFSGFETLVEKIIASKDGGVMNFNPFIRDELNGVARELLKNYGVTPTPENMKTGHLGREVHYTPQKVVPGITTPELIDLLIEKKKAGKPVYGNAVIPGFDDARTALEVASLPRESSDPRKYVKNGFTSMEQVSSVDLDKLKALEKIFDFRGSMNSRTYHEKNYDRLVSSYIRGKPERVDELIALGQNGGKDYLVAFDGSVEQTHRILKISPEERPSPESVHYARSILKVFEFKDAVAVAKEIDSPYEAVFSHEFSTKEEFLAFRDDFQKTLDDFLEKTGKKVSDKDDISDSEYDRIKAFKGDLRFISDGFGLYQTEAIEKVERVMDFDTYKGLNVGWKPHLIPALIDEGYTLVQMREAFSGKLQVDGYKLQEIQKKLKNTFSLSDMAEIVAKGIDNDYAVNMIRTVPFKEMGIPYEVIKSLESHSVQALQFRAFIDTVGADRYLPKEVDSKPSFDAVSMIKDLKVFYNKDKE